MTTKILTVCLGNICRSPTAEAALVEAAAEAGVDLVVDSAGTAAYHIGERPDRRMRAAGAAGGLPIDGQARQFHAGDFDEFDLILVMDRSNHEKVVRLAPSPEAAEKVRMYRSFDPDATDDEVPDPYYGGSRGFDEVVEMCRAAARGVIDSLEAGS